MPCLLAFQGKALWFVNSHGTTTRQTQTALSEVQAQTFAEPTITAGTTTIKASHITELRSIVSSLGVTPRLEEKASCMHRPTAGILDGQRREVSCIELSEGYVCLQ